MTRGSMLPLVLEIRRRLRLRRNIKHTPIFRKDFPVIHCGLNGVVMTETDLADIVHHPDKR